MQKIKVYKGFVRLFESQKEVEDYLTSLEDNSLLTFDWETTGLNYDAIPLGLALHQRGTEPCFIPVDYFFDKGIPMSVIAKICNREFKRLKLIAHNAKYDSMINVMNGIKDECCNIVADTLIMIHLYDPSLEMQLEKRVKEDFGYEKQTFDKICGKKWSNINWSLEGNDLLPLLAGYAGEDTYWETQVYYKYRDLLDEHAWRILRKIEMPLVKILRDAKIRGVLIDVPLLLEMRVDAEKKLLEYKDDIYKEAGCIFNLNSPKQKQKIFFEKLKLPVISKTKNGAPSTDADSAGVWASMGYPIGKALVAYSELQKLMSGYILPIPQLVDKENVLRGDINSCGTKTGRCSSSNPNLQNQPNNHDFPIRCAFIPRPGYVFINYDYSQLELRVMAHMSKDKKFIDIFLHNEDPHGDVAKRCGITRKQAKCVNPNTLIYTNSGVARIGDISSCRLEDTFDAPAISKVYNGVNMVGVNSFYSNGVNNTLGVVTKRGIVRCSEEHRFLLTDGTLKRAIDLKIGDELIDNATLNYEGKETFISYNPFFENGEAFSIKMDEQWAYIAGVLTGDGCFTQKHIGVAAGSGRFFRTWRETLRSEFAKKGLPLTERSNANYLYLGSSRFVKFMIPFGLSDKRGVKNFKIPMWVLNGSVAMRKSFLGGLIDTDGTVSENGTTSICTKSIQLAEDLCFLLNSIGYDFGVECAWNKTYEKYYYRVHIYSTSLSNLLESDVLKCTHKIISLTERVSRLGKGAIKKPNKVLQVLSLGRDYLCDLNVESEDHLYMTGTLVTHNTMNFGVLYGMGPDTYVREFSVSKERALQMIDDYHKTYQGFANWKTATENYAKKKGYVRNLFGRIRRFSEATKNPYTSTIDRGKYFSELRQSVNCVDTETEIFTKRGWLRYDEVHEGDIALTYNGDKDIMEWQHIIQVVRMPYVGDMISMEGEAHSSLSTPNHRWFVRDSATGPCITRDSEFIFNMSSKGSYRFPLCADIIESDNQDFSDEWLELFGVFITDGFHESLHQIGLCQSSSIHKKDNIERIEYLISKVGDEIVRERDHSWGKYDACHYWTLRGEFTEWCKIVTNQMKRVTEKSWLYTLSQRQADKLLDGVILGDGCKSKSCKTVYIGNIHKYMIDFYAEVALLAGKSYGISAPGKDSKNRDYVISIKSRGNVYCGLLERKKVHYKGVVWCPRVENQSFLMRRNGKVCITRNTIIQGTGADIVKLATIAMCNKFEELNLDAHFLLQVHDEVLIEARIDQMRDVEKVVIDCMENTVKLDVPLRADGKILANWGEMKDDNIPSLPDRFDYSLYLI